jgi:hypothetical protein
MAAVFKDVGKSVGLEIWRVEVNAHVISRMRTHFKEITTRSVAASKTWPVSYG